MTEVEYVDTGVTGSPAAVEKFVRSLGWRPEGSEPVALAAGIEGFAPLRTDPVNGTLLSFALIRSTTILTLPAGVTIAPAWMTGAAVGGFAEVSTPSVETTKLQDRMTKAELVDFEGALLHLFGAERAAEILG